MASLYLCTLLRIPDQAERVMRAMQGFSLAPPAPSREYLTSCLSRPVFFVCVVCRCFFMVMWFAGRRHSSQDPPTHQALAGMHCGHLVLCSTMVGISASNLLGCFPVSHKRGWLGQLFDYGVLLGDKARAFLSKKFRVRARADSNLDLSWCYLAEFMILNDTQPLY